MSDRANHLAILLPDLNGGGTQRVAVGLANALVRKGWRVDVVSLRGADSFFPLHTTISVLDLTEKFRRPKGLRRRVQGIFRRWIRWRRYVRTERPDIVLSMLPMANVVAVFGSMGLQIPVVISERNDPAIQRLRFDWEWLRRRTYRWADAITANSEAAIREIGRVVPDKHLERIPNAVYVPKQVVPFQADRPYFLAIGRLNRQKAFDVLIAAFSRISNQLPEWDLRIVGEGPERGCLVRQIEALKLSGRVVLHGAVNDPFSYYAGAKVFVLPSRHEGVPNAMLEAMAARLPVIVSDASSGPLEYVRHGESGLVVKSEDSAMLAESMRLLVENSNMREQLGYVASEAVGQLKDEAISEQWISLLTRTMQSEGVGRTRNP